MTKVLKQFLSKIFVAIFLLTAAGVASAATANIPTGDIGDFGSWATPHNREMFVGEMSNDISQFQGEFQSQQLVGNYVPIEARVGLAFMNALSWFGGVLDNSLIRFVNIFLIVAFIFWMMFEAYNMMTKGSKTMPVVEGMIKKAALIVIWIIVLNQGPAQIFMWVMGPIIGVGTYLSDLILNAVSGAAGVQLPDTCAAIREYTAANISQNMIVDAAAAADMMCVPTRLSGFFYSAVAAGWKWMLFGIGHSAFTFVIGAVFVVVFLFNIWKFALIAFGVIADLFLTIFMLPFTAIAETIGKTSYKGIAGDIFNGFLGLFKTQSLSVQIQRFINSAIYFVSLSIVIGVCMGLMSGIFSMDMAASVPTIDNYDFVTVLLTGLLTAYLADKAQKIAKDLGGSIDYGMGTKIGGDALKWGQNLMKEGQKVWKIVRSGGEKK